MENIKSIVRWIVLLCLSDSFNIYFFCGSGDACCRIRCCTVDISLHAARPTSFNSKP